MKGGGFVNAHTHIYSGLAPFGMPSPAVAPTNFPEILERIWWRLDRALDENSLAASARFYVADALRHGTIALIDHHESPSFIEGSLDVLADVCHELGLRAVVCYGATERNFGRDEARRGLAECRRFIQSNRRPLVRGVVGLHASFTVSDETIREAGDLCRDLGSVLHIHVAEDAVDVHDANRRGYDGPLERLEALGALPAGSILAHGVHLNAAQVKRASELGCWIVQNPRSNRNNSVGYPAALSASERVAVGTDGFSSDIRDEMSALAEEAAAHGEPQSVVPSRVAGGPSLLAELWNGNGRPSQNPDLTGTCEMGASGVARLSLAGRELVRDGRLQTGDFDAIQAEAREAAAKLWQRMQKL